MNMEALYGVQEAAKLSRAGAQALGLQSLQSLPSAISPFDTQKAINAAKARQPKGLNSPLIFLVIAVLILWALRRG